MMKDEDEISARRQRQRRYFWKQFCEFFGYELAFIAVFVSPLYVGKYLSRAWGECEALALFFALLFAGIKTGAFKRRWTLFVRILLLLFPAMELLFAIILFSKPEGFK